MTASEGAQPDRFGVSPAPDFEAIILSGGRARRMGGAAKTHLHVAGSSLLRRTRDAARGACGGAVIVAGDMPDGATAGIVAVREDPTGGGPVAAIAAAAPHLRGTWVMLLAGDLVDGAAAVALLRSILPPSSGSDADVDAIVLMDPSGRPQWLCSAVRVASLQGRLRSLPDAAGARMAELFEGLTVRSVPAPAGVTADIDTWEDLSRARSRGLRRAGAATEAETDPRSQGETMSEKTLPPEALDAWSSVLRDRFGLDVEAVPIAMVLDLARDVAHDVARPAAPLSAFVAGLVAGRAGGSPEATAGAVAEITALAASWAQGAGEDAP